MRRSLTEPEWVALMPLALGVGMLLLRDAGAGVSTNVQAVIDALKQKAEPKPCHTAGYGPPRWRSTDVWSNLSPSLRGCYADPIEVALEEHFAKMPPQIDDPGVFETLHQYTGPDAVAWPKQCKVITACRQSRLETYVVRPDETLSVFLV